MSRRTWTVRAADGVAVRAGRWDPAEDPADGATGDAHVLLLQGRGDFLEKWDDVASALARAGTTVLSLDWRGQGGSSRLGAHPGLADLVDLGDLLADLDAVVADSADRHGPLPGRRLLVGHSMGALTGALRLADRPDEVDAAVLLSPMFRFPPPLATRPVAAAARLAAALGLARRAAPGERPGAPGSEVAMATEDPAGRAELADTEHAHPDKVVGGSTWRWAGATARGMLALQAAPLGRVGTDVLLAVGGRDRTVDGTAAHPLAARLPRARVVTYPRAGHDLLRSGPLGRQVLADLVHHLRLPAVVTT